MEPNSALKKLIDNHPLNFERFLVLALIQHHSFYLATKAHLCPIDPKTGLHRMDFKERKFNDLYPIIAAFWDIFGDKVMPCGIPRVHLEAAITDAGNEGRISMESAQALLKDTEIDFYNMPVPAEFCASLGGPTFAYWMDTRLAVQAAQMIYSKANSTGTSLEDIEKMLQASKNARVNMETRVESAASVIRKKTKYKQRFRCGIDRLNIALGGGFMIGETTMIAGTNGAGKTVLAMQLAHDFIVDGRKTVVVTTEQRPIELIGRIVSNHLDLPFKAFTERADLLKVMQDSLMEADVSAIPDWIADDPNYGPKYTRLMELFDNLQFVDWSEGQGLSAVKNFAPEMEKLVHAGLDPDVVVFDWIGGGLDNTKGDKVEIRHLYQQTADYLINWAKKHKKVMILMAQFDKVKATDKPRPSMAMLSECKTMSNNVTNFIGITSMMEKGEGDSLFLPNQGLYVEKARNGIGGLVKVERWFHVQKFVPKTGMTLTTNN